MKKGFRKLALALCAALVMTTFAACSAKEDANSSSPQPDISAAPSGTVEKETVRVAALKGPTAIGMAKLMEDNDSGQAKNEYQFTIAAAADDIVGKLTSGEVDIAAIPTNLAATLYQKTSGGIEMLAVNTLGVQHRRNQICRRSERKNHLCKRRGQCPTVCIRLYSFPKWNGSAKGCNNRIQD